MRNGKYTRSTGFKPLALLLAMALLVGCAIGGTLAWLTDKTDEVTNTFTTSKIKIELKETTETYKMVPGWTIEKNPKAKVETGSEECWLFVKVEESCNVPKTKEGAEKYQFTDFIEYTIADGWSQLTKDKDGKDITDKIYYRKVEAANIGTAYSVLKDDKVTVKTTVTKEMMEAVTTGNTPKLTFTAYASQLYKTNKPTTGDVSSAQFSPADAWANVPKDN